MCAASVNCGFQRRGAILAAASDSAAASSYICQSPAELQENARATNGMIKYGRLLSMRHFALKSGSDDESWQVVDDASRLILLPAMPVHRRRHSLFSGQVPSRLGRGPGACATASRASLQTTHASTRGRFIVPFAGLL